MTNNINCIDVSECSYYNKDNEPYCCEIWDNECEAQNCYFKQLKRLQEENKKLKNKNNDLIEVIASGNIDIAILQKENEELKNKIESYNCNANCYKYKEANKYKQALEEIRKEIWEQNRSCDNCPDERNGYCIGFNECAKNIIDNFLLKINEVLK